LDEQLWNRLHFISKQSGTSLSELVRRAVRDRYALDPADRRDALRAAAGLWADRTDLPATEAYVRELRKGDRLKRLAR